MTTLQKPKSRTAHPDWLASPRKSDTGYLQSLVASYRFYADGRRRQLCMLSTAERAEHDAAVTELVLRGDLAGL